jgi:hypothetical protein
MFALTDVSSILQQTRKSVSMGTRGEFIDAHMFGFQISSCHRKKWKLKYALSTSDCSIYSIHTRLESLSLTTTTLRRIGRVSDVAAKAQNEQYSCEQDQSILTRTKPRLTLSITRSFPCHLSIVISIFAPATIPAFLVASGEISVIHLIITPVIRLGL